MGNIVLSMLVLGAWIGTGRAIEVKPVAGPGFLVSHEKTLMIKTGNVDLTLNTNNNITLDKEIITRVVDTMDVFCKYLQTREFPAHECANYANNIRDHGRKLLDQLTFQKIIRRKRSEGLLMWLIHLVIGTDEDNTQNEKRTTVLVQHTLENFKRVETQIEEREKVLATNQKKLGAQLDKLTKQDSSALRLLELTHYVQCKELLEVLKEKYDELVQGKTWTMTEVELFKNQTAHLPAGHMLPPTSLSNLIKLADTTILETATGTSIIYVLPLVSVDIYEEIRMIAIPDIQRKQIANVDDKLAVNHVKDLFFLSSDITQRVPVNASWDIVQISRSLSISASDNCLAHHAVDTTNKTPCKMIPLPTHYDEWKVLIPQHEYFYYTTYVDETYLQCQGKERFTRNIGIVRVPPGCTIQSKTGLIYGSADKTATIKRHYAIALPEVNNITTPTTQVKLQNMKPVHDDTDQILQEAAQDLIALNSPTIWMWVTIGLGNIIIIGMSAMLATCLYKRYRTRNNQTSKKTPDESNAEQMLEMTNRGEISPPQTPCSTPRMWGRYTNN